MVVPSEPTPAEAGDVGPATRGEWRVVVDSIGRADARLIAVLAQALRRDEREVAASLLRAPAVLLDEVPRPLAEQTVALLGETGLELRVLECEAEFQPGEGHIEVALLVHELDQISEIVAEVARVVGCSVPQAIELCCGTPAVLLAGISAAAADALRRRFEDLGAQLLLSDAREARYDVLLADSEASPSHVERLLAGLGVPTLGRDEAGPLVAVDLDRAQAEALWQRMRGNSGPLRVLDRAFTRYDLRLLALNEGVESADPAALADWLVADTGMPPRLAGEIGRHLPLVLHEDLSLADAQAKLVALAELGARAEALMATYQTFDLELRTLGNREQTTSLLAGLGRVPAKVLATLEPRLARLPLTIPGPFAKLRARWLAHECARVGTRLELIPR